MALQEQKTQNMTPHPDASKTILGLNLFSGVKNLISGAQQDIVEKIKLNLMMLSVPTLPTMLAGNKTGNGSLNCNKVEFF